MEAKTKNPNNPVVWFEIYVDNMDRAKKFYEAVLNIDMDDMADPNDPKVKMYSFPKQMDKPDASGAIVKTEGFKPGGNGTIVYFGSQDCAVEEARVSGSGGKILKGKMPIGEYGFMSLCIDTEGNTFGLHSMK